MFSHLQVRSAYSFLSGACRIEDLVARAKELGYGTMALTDSSNLYGVHAFIEATEAAGIRPIIGAELRVEGGRLLALVRDREGFGNLCELVSAEKAVATAGSARADAGVSGPRDLLISKSRGLIYASCDTAVLDALRERVPRLYAGVTPRRLGALPYASRRGIPLLALGDASLIEKSDWEVHRLLRAIGEGATLGKLGSLVASGAAEALDSPGAILFGPEEAQGLFASWPAALAANEEVARDCAFSRIFDGFTFPSATGGDRVAVPGGDRAADPAEAACHADEAYARLRRLAFEGAQRRYGEVNDAVVDRLEYELDIIGRKNFTDYFLVVAQIAGFTARTCGRGSGAASAVAYSLGITNVDPIRHHLYFERFLNEARPDPPDIDIDFAWDERDEVMRRAIEAFGSDRAARVANHLFFRPRSAIREAAKAWGMPDGEIAACERSVFEGSAWGNGSWSGGASGGGGLEAWRAKPLWKDIIAAATRIEGLPRGISMHCGGLVIAPGPIRRLAPVESSAEGYPLLQWEKDGTEAAGLVKIDLLGNRSLAVIRDAVANIAAEEDRSGEGRDSAILADQAAFERMALGDARTIDMLARGDTMGVFYIESPAMRQLQKKAGVGDYEHIVIHSSIIRPAANKYIAEYVKRLHGGTWEPLHPRLAKVLDETYGIMVYQEDVSKAAIALAGFDESDADALRKILAKKNKARKLAECKTIFFEGCAKHGVEAAAAECVWEMMESFAGYSFCKPHSASYAVVSFQSAWLRCHHPAEFMAAVLSNQGGFYTASAYVSEARRMGLAIAGPDVNESGRAYRASGGRLVVGLMAIGGLSRATMDAIAAERAAHGPFRGLADFTSRLALEAADIVALAESGALDSIAATASRAMAARSLLCARGEPGAAAGGELFSADGQGGAHGIAAPGPGAPTSAAGECGWGEERRVLSAEYRCLGFLRERHPLSLWKREVDKVERTKAADLAACFGKIVTIVAMPVTRKEVLTRGKEEMSFVSLEDETAIIEAVLFPEAFERYGRLFFDLRPLVVEGRVERDQGAVSFEITKARPLDNPGKGLPDRRGAGGKNGPWR